MSGSKVCREFNDALTGLFGGQDWFPHCHRWRADSVSE